MCRKVNYVEVDMTVFYIKPLLPETSLEFTS